MEDGDTTFRVVFFAGRKIKFMLPVGTLAMFDGTVSRFRRSLDLKHPEFLVLRPVTGPGIRPGIVSVSRETLTPRAADAAPPVSMMEVER